MSGSFTGIVRFELRFYLRRISTWVYFGLFFTSAFLLIQLAGGVWDQVQMNLGGSGGNILINSPYSTALVTGLVSIFGVMVTAALFGDAACRDFETGSHPLFFTTPLSKAAYLGGRFTGAMLINSLIFAGIPLGLMLGAVTPWLDAERFGDFRAMAYLHPMALFVLPNLLFTGAIFFALAALSRRMLPNYIGGVFLFIGYLMSGHYLENLENQRLAAFLDPFGFGPFHLVSKYWTPAEKNTLLAPLDGLMLTNRLVWVGIGVTFLAVALVRFQFAHHAREARLPRRRRHGAGPAGQPAPVARTAMVPSPRRTFGLGAQLQQFASIARRSFWSIVRNRYFFAIVGGGVIYMIFISDIINEMYGTTTWPVTYAVLDVLGANFWLFMIIVISLYAGDLVWQEREVRMSQVFDSTPLRDWVPLAAKWAGLAMMLVVLQAVVMLTGMAIQAVKGYTNFEIGLYLRTLFGAELLGFLLLSAVVMLVHVVANHKYFAHLVVILFLVFTSLMGEMGLEHSLYRYNSGGMGSYSDMNGFGPYPEPFFWFKGYWLAWALLFAVLSNLFWVRGEETGARWRIRLARLRFTRPALTGAGVALVLIVGLGGFIFYNTNVVNEYRTTFQREAAQAEYERLYGRFEGAAQPRVVGVSLNVELYPERRDVVVSGRYRLQNRTGVALDSIHLLTPHDVEARRLELGRAATLVQEDEEHGYRIFRLAEPLAPGDSLTLDFEVAFVTRGFANAVDQLDVVENGTFFNSSKLPGIGYDADVELADDETRRKHGLEPRERMARAEDLRARGNNYISRDADWIDFEVTVGTRGDQIAIAPGYLQREWHENGRRYFHFKMDAPILNFYSVLSARYAVKRDRWKDVAIEVYYHPGHEYNLDRMIEGVKKSLDYFTAHFGPYQHRQVRIVEFPRYQAFAQSFPNTIPYSEAIGFIARVEDPETDIDYPFYVTAHEVAHQWWAHQVIGGKVQGSTLMSETLSQYAALMVMEKEYGREQIRRFLGYELDRYLRDRGFERKKELPLLRVENQGYIHYRKGAVAMYALRDYLGEDRLNRALRSYLEAVRFQEPPYTNSLEFYGYLQAATPDSLRYVLEDLFEHITLYDNRAREAKVQPTGDGRYRVTLQLEARKLRADSLGNESPFPMNDWVDVGVFAENPGAKKELGPELYLQKHRIRDGEHTVEVVVDQRPARAGIDPYHKLIDRNSDDNTVALK